MANRNIELTLKLDNEVLDELTKLRSGTKFLADKLGVSSQVVSRWRKFGISAGMRPTIWAIAKENHPDLLLSMDRDEFLKVRKI